MDPKTQRPAPSTRGLSFHFEMGMSWTPKGAETSKGKTAEASKNNRASLLPKKKEATVTKTRTSRGETNHHHHKQCSAEAAPTSTHDHRSGARHPRQPRTSRHPHADAAGEPSRHRNRQRNTSPTPWRASPSHSPPQAMLYDISTYGAEPPRAGNRRHTPEVWKSLPPTPTPSIVSISDFAFLYPGQEIPVPESSSDDSNNGQQRFTATIVDPAVDLAPWTGNERPSAWGKDMQSLATAMMTVDNGFEDQWWNQGTRLVNIGGQLIPANVGGPARGYYPPGPPEVVSAVSKSGMDVRTAVDEVSVPSSDRGVGDLVSPISNASVPVVNYVYYR